MLGLFEIPFFSKRLVLPQILHQHRIEGKIMRRLGAWSPGKNTIGKTKATRRQRVGIGHVLELLGAEPCHSNVLALSAG